MPLERERHEVWQIAPSQFGPKAEGRSDQLPIVKVFG